MKIKIAGVTLANEALLNAKADVSKAMVRGEDADSERLRVTAIEHVISKRAVYQPLLDKINSTRTYY